jgi:hypothetical protein
MFRCMAGQGGAPASLLEGVRDFVRQKQIGIEPSAPVLAGAKRQVISQRESTPGIPFGESGGGPSGVHSEML